jgi:hypothetical protein
MIDFDLARPDNRVEYDIWYSSSSVHALDFISDFWHIDRTFGPKVLMTPHFRFFSASPKEFDAELINRNCYGNGKYCAYEHDNENLSGREIILEDLR